MNVLTNKKIVIKTSNKVFKPNLTTEMFVSYLSKLKFTKKKKILDLGCGTGTIGIYVKKKFKKRINLYMSDLSTHAVRSAINNAKSNNIECEIKKSNLFVGWVGQKFDIIINDVSAISYEIAKNSQWYNKYIPHNCGESGIELTKKIISESKKYLNRNGMLILPIISLSRHKTIEKFLNKNFKKINLIDFKEWPLPEKLDKKKFYLNKKNENFFSLKYGIKVCFTKIISAKN